MKFRILALAATAALCVNVSARAQVTATITDSDGQTWNNGTWSAALGCPNGSIPTVSGTPVTPLSAHGALSSGGALSVSIATTTSLDQAGCLWTWTLHPNASTGSSVVATAVTSTTQNLSTTLSNGVTAPRFQATPMAFGYLDAEIYPSPVLGATYTNVALGFSTYTYAGWVRAASGGGSGTVTGFSSGALSPLFTSSVSNPNTTPAISFTLSNAAQNAVFAGPATGGTGASSYRALVLSDLPTSIPNANLANTATTVNGQTCTLGSTCTVTAASVETAGTGGVAVNTFVSRIIPATSPITYTTAAVSACGEGVALATATATNTFGLSDSVSLVQVVADGAIVAGDIVIGSPTTAGDASDSGQTSRTSISNQTDTCGIAQTSTTAAGQLVTIVPFARGTKGAMQTLTAYLARPAAVTITPTANINILGYTGHLGTQWNVASSTVTEGQSDENSAATATLQIPSTAGVTHQVAWNFLPTQTNAINGYVNGGSSTAFACSIWVKGSGYTSFNMGTHWVIAGVGTYSDNWFNTSANTVTSSATGFTNTIVAAGNGYSLISELFTLPANATFDIVYLGFSSTTNLGFVGNGTSGGYMSHPQCSATSTVQTYQEVQGTISYGVAAINAAGQSTDVVWTPCNALICSVVTPSVSGTTTCALYRTGYTAGTVGTSTITCGATVADTNTAAAATSTAPPATNQTGQINQANLPSGSGTLSTVNIVSPDIRALRMQKSEYVTVTSAGTYRIFQAEPGAPGSITHIHVSINSTGTGVNGSTMFLKFTGSCVPGGGSETVSLGLYLLAQDAPTSFLGSQIGVPVDQSAVSGTSPVQEFSANQRAEIPYTSGCNIDLVNTTTTTSAYIDVQYKVGQWYSAPWKKVWHPVETTFTSIAAFAAMNWLPTQTITGGGQLESVRVWFNSNNGNNSYFEADPIVLADAYTSVSANGSEDFFGSGFYCNSVIGGGAGAQSDKWGCWVGTGLQYPTSNADVLAYRYFTLPGDEVLFNSTLAINSTNGTSGQGSSPGTISARALVTYWGAN